MTIRTNKSKLFAWDFHGTLEQGTEVGFMQILKELAREINYPLKINLSEVRKLYGETVLDYLRHFFPKLSAEEHFNLRIKIRTAQNNKNVAKHIKAAPYAREVLAKIKKRGHKNVVVSTSSEEHINWFLKHVGIATHLDDILAIDRHMSDAKFDIAKEKAKIIQNYVQKHGFAT